MHLVNLWDCFYVYTKGREAQRLNDLLKVYNKYGGFIQIHIQLTFQLVFHNIMNYNQYLYCPWYMIGAGKSWLFTLLP